LRCVWPSQPPTGQRQEMRNGSQGLRKVHAFSGGQVV
jgi:hypothetical protein